MKKTLLLFLVFVAELSHLHFVQAKPHPTYHIALLPAEVKEVALFMSKPEDFSRHFTANRNTDVNHQVGELAYSKMVLKDKLFSFTSFALVYQIFATLHNNYSFTTAMTAALGSHFIGDVFFDLINLIVLQSLSPIYKKVKGRLNRSCKAFGYSRAFIEDQSIRLMEFEVHHFTDEKVYMNGNQVTLQKAIDLDLLDRRHPTYVYAAPLECIVEGFFRKSKRKVSFRNAHAPIESEDPSNK